MKMLSSDSIAQCENRCVLNLETEEITPLMVPLPDAQSQVTHAFVMSCYIAVMYVTRQ